jgi:hypothetical protein
MGEWRYISTILNPALDGGVFISGGGLQKLPNFNYVLYIRVRENRQSMF